MGHAGNQLAHRRHLFALQQLLLGAAQIFVGPSGFVVELNTVNGSGKLPAHGDHYAFIRRAEFVNGAAAGAENAKDLFLAP